MMKFTGNVLNNILHMETELYHQTTKAFAKNEPKRLKQDFDKNTLFKGLAHL